MGLKIGDVAPDFKAQTHDGQSVQLSSLWDRGPLVLFFYPKAFTPGCTAEVCHFRDRWREFERLGAKVLGVSTDASDTQARFAEENQLPFLLIGDDDGTISKAYGVKRRLLPFDKRTTFVIARGGRILSIIHDEFSMEIHADRALEVLEASQSSGAEA